MESTATILMENEKKAPETLNGAQKPRPEACKQKPSPKKAKKTDAWDEVNTFRKALTSNSHGYLATTAALVIGACFMVSLVVGAGLAMPVIAALSAYHNISKYRARLKLEKCNGQQDQTSLAD